jgi:hypothetical protein
MHQQLQALPVSVPMGRSTIAHELLTDPTALHGSIKELRICALSSPFATANIKATLYRSSCFCSTRSDRES